MKTMMRDYWNDYAERVYSLLPQQATGEESLSPVYYDVNHLWDTVAVPALQVAAVLYVMHFALVVPLCQRYLLPSSKSSSSSGNSNISSKDYNYNLTLHRLAFTATNFLINLVLVAIGFYLEADDRRQAGYRDVTERLGGHEYITFLPSWHVGVQLWSFPIGLFLIEEDAVMLWHHVALVWTAILPCCMHVGYRWHVPFFFGIFELSSLPLGVMNMFKAHPTWHKEYPEVYQTTRVVFAIVFLLVRILWCVPRMLLYMLDQATYAHGLLFLVLPETATTTTTTTTTTTIAEASSPSLLFLLPLQAYLVLHFVGAALLMWMQFLWGSKVTAGLVRKLFGKSSSSQQSKTEKST